MEWRARLRRELEQISTIAGKLCLGYSVQESFLTRLVAGVLLIFRPSREMAIMQFAGLSGPAEGTVLDVGCGAGALLIALRNVGWQVSGLEADINAAVAVRANAMEIHVGTLENLGLQSGRFSRIILNHVIEHLPNPVGSLHECGRLLAPGGQIIVITPNLYGFAHAHFRRFWRGLEIPRHLVIFSPGSLRTAGEIAGLQVEELPYTDSRR